MTKQHIQLGTVQETLLITLWARATEASQPDPILVDDKSVEIVSQIDYDFSKLAQIKDSQVGVCLRGQILDIWVKEFLDLHPDGVVVEIGAGLNTRFNRVDNGRVQWFDLDLPDSMALRSKFFTDTDRRHSISSSVLDSSWIERVQLAATDKALMFVAEGVLMYLSEAQVKQLISTLIDRFPSCQFAFDSMAPLMVENQKRHDALKLFEARFDWSINDIADLADWNPQYRVLKTVRMCDLTQHYLKRISLFNRLMMLFPPFANAYRLALAQLG
jgi:O-methyltransferase involved in polyketide biosynthesis